MPIDITQLNAVQDSVFENKVFWPEGNTTFCNLAALKVAQGVDCHALDAPQGQEPLLADEIYGLFKGSKDFVQRNMVDVQGMVNAGTLIFAILPSAKLGQAEGHVCTLTPSSQPDYSEHWDAVTPMCMNLGRAGTCFRKRGINWAFRVVPEFWAWGPSL